MMHTSTQEHVFRVGSFFCGLGAGQRGVLRARMNFPSLGHSARFESAGGIDIDPLACADFERLAESSALCCDIREMTPDMLRDLMGDKAPDALIGSPPCQGYSRLLPQTTSRAPFYAELNRLVLVWVELVLRTWPDAPPKLILIENVEGIQHRGAELLAEVRRLLGKAGYVFHASTHDCGVIGGLAQHRSRFLLVARHAKSCANLLYTPPEKRVRGCGEVIGQLAMPGDPKGGPLHALPRMRAANWVRIALIPAGGDWRDLAGVLADGQARRAVFQRYKINRWDEPCATIAGSGTNGVYGVADLRVKRAYDRGYGVLAWNQAAQTVAGGSAVGQGAYSLADPRVPDAEPVWIDTRSKALLDKPPVIIAADGTWHRPFTLLDLAALQGLPATLGGEPLTLAGNMTSIRTRIGNAIPVDAAEAIGLMMLATLLGSEIGACALSGTSKVWVDEPEALSPGWIQLAH